MIGNRPTVALTAAALVVLGGCAGTSDSGTAAPSPTPTSVGSSAPTHKPGVHQSPTATPSAAATEFSPPGDIPDNQVFVDYRSGHVQIKVPEGWARSRQHGTAVFTDKYNSISLQVLPRRSAPTVTSARRSEVPQLQRSQSKFVLQQVSSIQRQHGTAVLVTYLLDSAPSSVTGKVVRDAAERYEFWQHGQEAVLTLTGPQNADNVDPWRLVSDSLQWR